MIKKFLCLLLALFLVPSVGVGFAAEDAPLTRLEAVKLLQVILPSKDGGTAFDDTADTDAVYYKDMRIVHAIDGNNFYPDNYLTTQEFLLMLKRTLDRAHPDLFYDNQAIKWHYDQNEIEPAFQSQLAFLSAIGVYNNSGYLHPTSVISHGMAGYYLSLARHAIVHGTKSQNGQFAGEKPDVLMYHVIAPPQEANPYVYVSEEHFEEQIRYFYDNGYTFLFPEELSLKNRYDKAVVITFDDGYVSVYENALPVLKKYNAKATMFVITSLIGTKDYCTGEQLFAMCDSGVFRIGSHTNSHPQLTALTEAEVEHEFALSNDILATITKQEITSVAYPYGFFDETVLKQARRYYKTGFSVTESGSGSVHELTRTTIDDTIPIEKFPSYL